MPVPNNVKAGYATIRQHGSHVQVTKTSGDGRTTTFPVPTPSGKNLKSGTSRGILRLASLSVDELMDLL